MYAIRGEGLYFEVDDIITYFIVAYDDKTSVRADQSVMHLNGMHAIATFLCRLGGLSL